MSAQCVPLSLGPNQSHPSSMKANRPQHGTPALTLVKPVGKGALGHQDDVRSADAQALVHVRKDADAL